MSRVSSLGFDLRFPCLRFPACGLDFIPVVVRWRWPGPAVHRVGQRYLAIAPAHVQLPGLAGGGRQARASRRAGRTPTVVDAPHLAVRSIGQLRGTAWVLDESGYVGTYLRLDAPAAVTVAVRPGPRRAPASRSWPSGVGDARVGFEIGPERDYPETFNLPAGTHFLRVDFIKSPCSGTLAIGAVSVWGAALANENSDENALAAADSYITSYRRGRARLRIDGAAPGTPVHVHLKRHAFHFGVNIPGTSNQFLVEGAPASSEAGRFQRFVLDHFNTIVPSNAGKWLYNEAVRDFVTMDYVDLILRWGARHGLYTRMHTLLWDSDQQPGWVLDLLGAAAAGNVGAKEDLSRAIAHRLLYYVRDRGEMYQELDVFNEGLHHPRYLELLGPADVRDVFNQVARSSVDVGGAVRGYVNEYNVLQSSRVLTWGGGGKEGAPDPFANWYRSHVETLRAEGAELGGVGVQYYADARAGIESPHSPARIYNVLQNLTAAGLPDHADGVRRPAGRVGRGRGADPRRHACGSCSARRARTAS